jgi:hypothetical protein
VEHKARVLDWDASEAAGLLLELATPARLAEDV